MRTFVNEETVMKFYIELIDKGEIVFLKDKNDLSQKIKEQIQKLLAAGNMNEKIMVACALWKLLFEASMSFISPNRSGYDKLFKYFDAYVEFEELIFASDSFYRDHTLHCIWVYFLGEYIRRKSDFKPLFTDEEQFSLVLEGLNELDKKYDLFNEKAGRAVKLIKNLQEEIRIYDEAARCVAGLTHDLGYPIKKIEKINKSIKKVLPFFSINSFSDFSFEYNNIQQGFIDNFIDLLSRDMKFDLDSDLTDSEAEAFNDIFGKIFVTNKYGAAKDLNREALDSLAPEVVNRFKGKVYFSSSFASSLSAKQAYLNDFENYQHGIMSAFLLEKNLGAFRDIEYDRRDDKLNMNSNRYPAARMLILTQILGSISFHTCESMTISEIDADNYLTFIDELEEFSRISRASQNREYVKEFCETYLDVDDDGWFNIDFVFSNTELDNLDPEISFKGRCKRFLKLFNIPMLSRNLKLRVKCIDRLKENGNVYTLEIAANHAVVKVNDEVKNIGSYLKSVEY